MEEVPRQEPTRGALVPASEQLQSVAKGDEMSDVDALDHEDALAEHH